MTAPTLPLAPARDVPDDGLDVDPDLLADLARLPARSCDARINYILRLVGRNLWASKVHTCPRKAEWSVRVHCPKCPRTWRWLVCGKHRQMLLWGTHCSKCLGAKLKLSNWRRV